MLQARAGNVAVKVDGLDALMAKVEQAYRPVTSALEQFGAKRIEAAVARWPVSDVVGKRHSRDRLKSTVTLSSLNEVRVTLESPAPYTFFIKARNLGGKNPWQELIRKPTKARIEELADGVSSHLAREV